ncbi:MAG: TatD family hydrolase [Clostridiales bacterium]|nr:TatD family hydrolase [Clostridiales bacterium]
MEFAFERQLDYPLFDSHAHYNDSKFDEGRDLIIPALLAGNIKYIVNAGTNLESCAECIALSEKYEQLYAAVGIHPSDVNPDDDIEDVMDKLRILLSHDKVRALGEIGLDYHYDEPSRDVQQKWFIRQLELAREVKMPVVIHDRDAHGDVMDILRDFPEVTGVFHSFSASAEIARQLVNKGWYISFTGVITFKNAARLAEIVPTIPLDRVIIETDCPYLAPVPFRGKLNHSGLMEYTAMRAAELYGISVEEFCRHAFENSKRFYGIQ